MGILVEPGQAPRPGITIPDYYQPNHVSHQLASSLVSLAERMDAAGRPLDTLWTRDGVLEPPMRSQRDFSRVHRNHIRPEVVQHAIDKLDCEARVRDSGDVVMPAKKFWALIVLQMILSAIYALFRDG